MSALLKNYSHNEGFAK